ncbi:hypothetical protein OSTOST_17733 [Ostertagia ostertagi]
MIQLLQGQKSRAYRPAITSVPSGDFSGITTNRADYDQKKAMRSSPIRPSSSNLLLDGPMDALTITQADYQGRRGEKVIAVRPRSNEIEHGRPFEGHSTYQDGYVPKEATRQRSMRPKETNYASTDAFAGKTTQRTDFTKKKVDICPAEKVLSRRDRTYEFSNTRNGHDFYHHRITHASRSNSALVPVA